MAKDFWKKVKESARENETETVKERAWTNRIIRYISLTVLVIVVVGGLSGLVYVKHALSPVERGNDKAVEITIPIGSSSNDIASILKENDIIRQPQIFSFYLKAVNDHDLQAGHYELSKNMSADEILKKLQAGGDPIGVDSDRTLTIVEGAQLDEVAELVGEKTEISTEDFLKTANNRKFIREMIKRYPSMLAGIEDNDELKYPLEGYIYPATYDYFEGETAESLLKTMLDKSNVEYQKLKEDLEHTDLTYHQVLTLASLVEKEGVTKKDREMIAGVFFNRLAAGMPLQSDITVLYALGVHKEFVTYKDLEVDSPYNLYNHEGLGPGPFNNPGHDSIMAVIYPEYNNYYYFVADLNTQKIYYSSTVEEHDKLVEKYVNSRQASIEKEKREAEASQAEEVEEQEPEMVPQVDEQIPVDYTEDNLAQ